jgi:hypothetical protein
MFKKSIPKEIENLFLKQIKELKNLRIRIKDSEGEIQDIQEENEEILKQVEENFKNIIYLNEILEEKILIIKEIEETISKILMENKVLKEKNQIFKEIFSKNPIWHINSDNGWKINPKTNDLEQFKIPKELQNKKVNNVKISDDLKWTSFNYEIDKDKYEEYKIPRTLAVQLEIVDEIDNKIDKNKIAIKKIKSYKDFMDLLKTRKDIKNIELWKKPIDFLRFFRLKEFKKKDFVEYCKYKNRETPRKFLNKMIEIGFIERVKKGTYKKLVNIE